MPPHPVSIPHRFNSHATKFACQLKNRTCFNPSQVQFTLGAGLCLSSFPLVSIPHRFNSHRILRKNSLRQFISFNPSQVQFTPIISSWINFSKNLFQSLTGSIHTTRYRLKRWLCRERVSIPHRFNSHKTKVKL